MRLKMWLALMCLLAFLKPLDVAVAVTPTPTSTDMPSEVGADSVTYQIDAAHSGSLSGSNLRPPLKQLWSKEMEGTVLNPVVVGGTVYVVVRDHDKGPD